MGPGQASSSKDIGRFFVAHLAGYQPKESPHTNWRAYLKGVTSSPSNNVAELELTWLTALGFGTGTLNDRWAAYTKSLGYTGSPAERVRAFWAAW